MVFMFGAGLTYGVCVIILLYIIHILLYLIYYILSYTILFSSLLSYTLLLSSFLSFLLFRSISSSSSLLIHSLLLSSLPNIPSSPIQIILSFILYVSVVPYPYLYSFTIFSVQYVLKVVRELTWIVLRFSSRCIF